MNYDAVIIGAGPAGSHLGFLLARAGVKVAIVDRAVFPRDKLCGGLLTQKTLALLAKAYPDECFPLFPIKQMYLTYKQSSIASLAPLSPVNIVCRCQLDSLLLEFAVAQGAYTYLGIPLLQIDFEKKAISLKGEREIRYGYLIGADGALSKVRRLANIPATQLGFCLECFVPWGQVKDSSKLDANGIELICGDFAKGYGWVFPNQEEIVIGMGNLTSEMSEKEILRRFPNFLMGLVRPRKIKFRGAYVPSGTSVILGRPDYQDVGLVGDAAGLIDPITGEGLYYALMSAEKAADAVLSNNGGFFSTYCRHMQGTIERLKADVWVRDEFYRPFIMQDTFGVIQGAPQYIENLIDETIIRYEKPYIEAYKEFRQYLR